MRNMMMAMAMSATLCALLLAGCSGGSGTQQNSSTVTAVTPTGTIQGSAK